MFKTLRYLAKKTPCIIVNKRKVCEGTVNYESIRKTIIEILKEEVNK